MPVVTNPAGRQGPLPYLPLDVRLVIVTGKGGTGKTTVAATLAVAASRRGLRTLLVEVEGRQGLAALFDRAPLGHLETPLADGVNGLAVDPEAALQEYLGRYGFASLTRLLSWARLTRFITAAAPGLGDILLVGKVWEAVTRRRAGRPAYDLVVLDAPPTGRVVPFLRAPDTIAELARLGPIRAQADRVAELLDDPDRTRVVLVTLPEELPVTETLEGAAACRTAGLWLGPVVVNQVAPDELGGRARRLGALARNPAPLVAAAARAGVELDGAAIAVLVDEARDRQRQVARQRRRLAELRAGLGDHPVLELPALPGGVPGLAAIGELAAALAGDPADGAAGSRGAPPAPRGDR